MWIWPHRAVFAEVDSSGYTRQVSFAALFFFFSASEISHLIYLETFIKHLLISSGTRNSMRNKSVHRPCAQHFRAYGERWMFGKVSTDNNISI